MAWTWLALNALVILAALLLAPNVVGLPPHPVDSYNRVWAASTRGAPRWQSEVGGCGCSGCDSDTGPSNLARSFLQDKTSRVVGSREVPPMIKLGRSCACPERDLGVTFYTSMSLTGQVSVSSFLWRSLPRTGSRKLVIQPRPSMSIGLGLVGFGNGASHNGLCHRYLGCTIYSEKGNRSSAAAMRQRLLSLSPREVEFRGTRRRPRGRERKSSLSWIAVSKRTRMSTLAFGATGEPSELYLKSHMNC
ncbi:hypothetical protein B296_00022881 [Ensete ventricosum]|uniref:Uncharacterized protein n=1 Tax=Ensete ventricosum TaxID=4639 RepID=A0A427AXZ1_ENSVE|nr:hypothetical protein B296_00022881 [Ensete ventricosum]